MLFNSEGQWKEIWRRLRSSFAGNVFMKYEQQKPNQNQVPPGSNSNNTQEAPKVDPPLTPRQDPSQTPVQDPPLHR